MRVLGLIPARGGSKGVPGKNIRPLCGKPLLQYTVDAALQANRLTAVILSTDDATIADVGRRLGVEVPFLRPPELAQDDTPTLPVVQHALALMEQRGETFDAVCLLQPTCPLRSAQDIDACVELLETSGADSVIAVLPVPPKFNPHWIYFQGAEGTLHLATGEATPLPRRQDLPPAFYREGSVYVTRCDVVTRRNNLYGSRVMGYAMDPDRSVNIDSLADWEQAERLLEKEQGACTRGVRA